jgi:hypothetical protein
MKIEIEYANRSRAQEKMRSSLYQLHQRETRCLYGRALGNPVVFCVNYGKHYF